MNPLFGTKLEGWRSKRAWSMAKVIFSFWTKSPKTNLWKISSFALRRSEFTPTSAKCLCPWIHTRLWTFLEMTRFRNTRWEKCMKGRRIFSRWLMLPTERWKDDQKTPVSLFQVRLFLFRFAHLIYSSEVS